MSFGDYFRNLRKSKNVTQKRIAEGIGKTPMLVSGVETNKNKPFSDADLNKIAKILDLSDQELKDLLKEAAKERGAMPSYMVTYCNDHKETYQLLDLFVTAEMGSSSLQQIIRYAEEIRNA